MTPTSNPPDSPPDDWRGEWPTLAAAFAHVPLILYAWPRLPARVPVHWNWQGEVDRYGTRAEALLLVPVLLLLPLVLTYAVQGIEGGRNKPVLRVVRLGMALLSLLLLAQQAFGLDAGRTLLIGLGTLFTLLGNVMGKTQPSAFTGLRTPWTYLSRRAWSRSQRRAGLFFFCVGSLSLAAGLLAPTAWPLTRLLPLVIPALIVPGTLILVYLSYRDYKNDPNPEPVRL